MDWFWFAIDVILKCNGENGKLSRIQTPFVLCLSLLLTFIILNEWLMITDDIVGLSTMIRH